MRVLSAEHSADSLFLTFDLEPAYQGDIVAAYFSMSPMDSPIQLSPLSVGLSTFNGGTSWYGSLRVVQSALPYTSLTFLIPGYNATAVPLPYAL